MLKDTRVIVTATFNDGRYVGRKGTVTGETSANKAVVKLDEFNPGFETGDGMLYLYPSEFQIAPDDYIVEVNFFVAADSDEEAEEKVRNALDHAKVFSPIPRFTIAWVNEDES